MQVERYFELVSEVARLQRELDRTAAGSNLAMGLEHRLDDLEAERDRLLDDVEETIEAAISMAASTEGLSLWGGLLFPPVDIRLTGTPRLLVTSPRDRIERTHDVLVSSDIRLFQRERIEEALLRESDLSALVLDIGGLATYPAALPGNRPLLPTLRISAHEWLHHYFFFRPLGQHLFDNSEMQILNETAADIAGRELGDRAFKLLGGELPAPDGPSSRPTSTGAEPFDFRLEMGETRRRVDELLADGKVEEAEAYMNERRDVFADNMIFIRKLNQAYFAFHGTYAESAASVSPIGDQLRRFRDLTPSVGAFIRSISGLSSYEQFLRRLQELEADAASQSGRHPGAETGLRPTPAEGVSPQGGLDARRTPPNLR